MTYNVILKRRRDNGYVATVPALPGVRVAGATREETISSARAAIARRLTEVEVVPVDVGEPTVRYPYTADEMELARTAARRRGEPDAPIAGDPIIDFAGLLAHLSDEEWDDYQQELRRIREEDNFPEPDP